MGKVVVFGAGGRAGRAAVAEARRRGHEVTAVVRDPGKHQETLAGVRVVAGDVLDAASVAAVGQGHDAAISAVGDLQIEPGVFFQGAARSLVEGLAEAKVGRLVHVGLASVLPTESGVLLLDTDGYPQEYRSFSLGHAAGNEVLRSADTEIDWVVLSPAGDFDHEGSRTGHYRVASANADSRISYADFAIAVLDEIDRPAQHRTHLGVEDQR